MSWIDSIIEMLFVLFRYMVTWGFVFINKIITVIIGALFGFLVGLFFGDTILSFFAAIGITDFSMWQLGAVLGFIGSFFGGAVNFNYPVKQRRMIKNKH